MRCHSLLTTVLLLPFSLYSQTQTRDDAGLKGDQGATSGFFETSVPVNYPSGAQGWWHLLDVRHSNTSNNYAMQFSGGFWDQQLYFRKTANNASQPWSKVLMETQGHVELTSDIILQDNLTEKFIRSAVYGGAIRFRGNGGDFDDRGLQLGYNDNNAVFVPSITVDGNGGNVGIGTANPLAKLEVTGEIKSYNVGMGVVDVNTSTKNYVNFSSNNHGSVLISSNLYCSGDDNLKIAKTHPTMSGSAILLPGNSQPNQGSIVFYTSQPASITADASYNKAATMILSHNGNVGIGTITPAEKLSVNGKIRAKEIKVETTNWPDYVFEEDYKPTSLQETEAYIKTNKHLPEIPSAREAEANGISLGEMNAKLLKKIEELTLYIIEQEKRIEKLESK